MKAVSFPISFLRIALLAGGCLLAVLGGARADEEIHIRSRSPDKHFALRTHEKHGDGTVTYEDAEVIELPSHQVLMKIEVVDKPVSDLVWSQDSKRFAVYRDAGLRSGFTQVYEFAAGAFHELELPEVGPDEKALPANAHHDSSYISPKRWLDADTLLVYYDWKAYVFKGDNEQEVKAEGRYAVHFAKDGHAVVSQKGKLKITRGE